MCSAAELRCVPHSPIPVAPPIARDGGSLHLVFPSRCCARAAVADLTGVAALPPYLPQHSPSPPSRRRLIYLLSFSFLFLSSSHFSIPISAAHLLTNLGAHCQIEVAVHVIRPPNMAVDDQPSSEPPSRSTTPNSEEDRGGADGSFSLEGISLSLELDFDSATDSSASSPPSEEEVLTKAGIEARSDDLLSKHAATQKCGYNRFPPITEAAYIELADEPELFASGLELLKKPEPVEEIFYGRYSPARDTFVRDPHRVVSQIERFVITNAFAMAVQFVEHSRSMQILPELMCIGMPLGWVHAVTLMIKNILVSFRWFVVIDPTLKPNVFTCWAGHGAPHFPSASRAIFINARVSHLPSLVHGAHSSARRLARSSHAERRPCPEGKVAIAGRCVLWRGDCRVPQVCRESTQDSLEGPD